MTEAMDVVRDCLDAVIYAHETVADAAIDWPADAPMTGQHALDDAEQGIREVRSALVAALQSMFNPSYSSLSADLSKEAPSE